MIWIFVAIITFLVGMGTLFFAIDKISDAWPLHPFLQGAFVGLAFIWVLGCVFLTIVFIGVAVKVLS